MSNINTCTFLVSQIPIETSTNIVLVYPVNYYCMIDRTSICIATIWAKNFSRNFTNRFIAITSIFLAARAMDLQIWGQIVLSS